MPETQSPLARLVDLTRWHRLVFEPVVAGPNGIARDGTALVAFRDDRTNRIEWDGSTWVENPERELPVYVRTGYFSGRPGLVFAENGVLAHTVEAELLLSAGGSQFEVVVEAGQWVEPESRSVGPIHGTDHQRRVPSPAPTSTTSTIGMAVSWQWEGSAAVNPPSGPRTTVSSGSPSTPRLLSANSSC